MREASFVTGVAEGLNARRWVFDESTMDQSDWSMLMY